MSSTLSQTNVHFVNLRAAASVAVGGFVAPAKCCGALASQQDLEGERRISHSVSRATIRLHRDPEDEVANRMPMRQLCAYPIKKWAGPCVDERRLDVPQHIVSETTLELNAPAVGELAGFSRRQHPYQNAPASKRFGAFSMK